MASPTITRHDHILIPHTDGSSMPRVGLGVYKIAPESCGRIVTAALAEGYRHVDCAQLYRSESVVAGGLVASRVPRSEVFLTTKIMAFGEGSFDDLYASLVSSVRRLGGYDHGVEEAACYVDLFLVHTPRNKSKAVLKDVWLALERLRDEGKTRAIGVSNYGIRHLEEMKKYAQTWPPSVNQIELHPWSQQRDLVTYCRDHGILVQAYSPLATGARLDDLTLRQVAGRHGRSPAQVLIRYSLQKGWVPLVKTEGTERMRENMDVYTFELDEGDIEVLDSLDQGKDGALFPANIWE